jgi:hypothetical protein
MPKFNFHMGVTLRCYGNVEVEAESIEAALPMLTDDFVGDNITIVETTTDSGQDLAIIDVFDADTDEDFKGYSGHSLPSPYDPKPDAKLIAALRDMRAAYGRLHDFLSDAIEGGRIKESDLPDDYQAIVAQMEACAAADHKAKAIIAEIDAL